MLFAQSERVTSAPIVTPSPWQFVRNVQRLASVLTGVKDSMPIYIEATLSHMDIAEGQFTLPFRPAQRGKQDPGIQERDCKDHNPARHRADRGIANPLSN